MPQPSLTRAAFTDLEIRASRDGRTITGIAVPFGEIAVVDGHGTRERFIHGAFRRTISERGPAKVKLLSHHDQRTNPLGRATLLREDQGSLYAEFAVSRTVAGDEALELVNDGALDAFSIGFDVPRGGERHTRDGIREVTEARLVEVSLVNIGAYAGARVLGTRNLTADYDPRLDPVLLARRLALAGLSR